MSDNEPSVLTFTPDARDMISKMYARVYSLANNFGEHSRQHLEAARTLAHVMGNLVHWRKCTVMRDMADLSLYCEGDGIYFGLIFHPQRRRCTSKPCRAVINDDGTSWSYMSSDYVCLDGQHTPDYPLNCPAPGTWSFHS